jgi:hypothetical protein
MAYFFNSIICTGSARAAWPVGSSLASDKGLAALVKRTCPMNLITLQSTVMLRIELLTTVTHICICFMEEMRRLLDVS